MFVAECAAQAGPDQSLVALGLLELALLAKGRSKGVHRHECLAAVVARSVLVSLDELLEDRPCLAELTG